MALRYHLTFTAHKRRVMLLVKYVITLCHLLSNINILNITKAVQFATHTKNYPFLLAEFLGVFPSERFRTSLSGL